MELGNKSTRRIGTIASVAVLFILLLLGFSSDSASAANTVVGPPVPNAPSAESIRASKACGADGSACVPAATKGQQGPDASPDTATATPTGPTGDTNTDSEPTTKDPATGGAAPGKQPGDKTPAEVDPGGSGSSQPAFVQQDPSLSNGGATPDDNSADPLGVVPLDIPNFLINSFEIPPFLLPIYQACGSEYGVDWEVLAAINRIETNFGEMATAVSTAGAEGWMQFMPATWAGYGVDANGDKIKDPTNPVDAICAAANYLKASGYAESPERAVFAYNHADWYVDDVLSHARAYAEIPPQLISALTGLTDGARFPVTGDASYEGELSTRKADNKSLVSDDTGSSPDRREVTITGRPSAPVIAVNDGTISAIDATDGSITVTDAYGNRYSYTGLGSLARSHPVPRPRPTTSQADDPGVTDVPSPGAPRGAADMGAAKATATPTKADQAQKSESQGKAEPSGDNSISVIPVEPASPASDQGSDTPSGSSSATPPDNSGGSAESVAAADRRRAEQDALVQGGQAGTEARNTEDMRGRVYANPLRPQNQNRSTVEGVPTRAPAPSDDSGSLQGKSGDYVIYDGSKSGIYRYDPDKTDLKPLEKGSRVVAGTVLGRLADQPGAGIDFAIKPGGKDAPEIDPKPFLDGWKLLAETNIYNARGKNRFADNLGASGVLLLSKPALQRRVLGDPGLSIYECGRQDVASGLIDRRILAVLEYLRAKGFTLTVTSLECGHGINTSSGNVSEHSTGDAVDIAAFNGQVVSPATQGPGTFIDEAARDVMSLQGVMTPHQVISLTDYGNGIGFAMGDHDDHLHIGYRPVAGSETPGATNSFATLGADQWLRLTERLGEIGNPDILTTPSGGAVSAQNPSGNK